MVVLKKYKYILIVISFVILSIIWPLLIHYIYKYNELSKMYNEINYSMINDIANSDNNYSEYFDIETLTFKINSLSVYKYDYLGIDISYEVDSTYDDFWSATESLALYDMKDFSDNWCDDNDYFFFYYNHEGKINGKMLRETITSVANSKYNEVMWEYNGKTLKLKSLPLYTSITIMVYVIFIIMILIGIFASWFDKLQEENVKLSCFVECLSTISLYLGIYLILGILTKGMALFLLPVLWFSDRK